MHNLQLFVNYSFCEQKRDPIACGWCEHEELDYEQESHLLIVS